MSSKPPKETPPPKPKYIPLIQALPNIKAQVAVLLGDLLPAKKKEREEYLRKAINHFLDGLATYTAENKQVEPSYIRFDEFRDQLFIIEDDLGVKSLKKTKGRWIIAAGYVAGFLDDYKPYVNEAYKQPKKK
jgi:hypothetical protein